MLAYQNQIDIEPCMATIIPPSSTRPFVLIPAEEATSVCALDAEEIAASYRQYGALLIRGFRPDLDQFHAFTSQFCATSVFNESPGRALLNETHNIQSVNRGAEPFPLHPELSREPWKPDVCFFLCVQPPSDGGFTTVCDGVELARQMPAELREELQSRRLIYVQPTWPDLLRFWLGTTTPSEAQLASSPPGCPYRFVRAGGRVLRVFSRPALHRPMFLDAPAFGNFLLFARYYAGRKNFPLLDDGNPVPDHWMEQIKALGDRLSVPVRWEEGDLLMLDNTRFMHGRTAVTDQTERVIASYFGYLKFALPNPDEPADPIWRKTDFRPPLPPTLQGAVS